MKVVLVVAMSENRVIGRAGGLPWHLPEDLKHFKAVTMGHPMIMGRKTWDSIGRPLPGRRHIVVTRDSDFAAEGVERAASLDEALSLCRDSGAGTAMIIGGGDIFAQSIGIADAIELTEIHRHVDGDTWFPAIEPDQWRETARERHAAAGDGPAFSFVTLVRRSA